MPGHAPGLVQRLAGQRLGPLERALLEVAASAGRARRLNVSRLATVPSSRYFAVAGPNERCDRSLRRGHHAGRVGHRRRAACRATADGLEPLRAHHRPQAAAAGVAAVVADGGVADQVLAGRADDRDVSRGPQALAPAVPSPRRSGRPHRSRRRFEPDPPVVDDQHATGVGTRRRSRARRTRLACAAIAKCDDDRASLSRSVSGDLATTANLAEVVSGVPTSGLRRRPAAPPGPADRRRPALRGAAARSPSPTPPMKRRSTSSGSGTQAAAPVANVDPEVAAVITAHKTSPNY